MSRTRFEKIVCIIGLVLMTLAGIDSVLLVILMALANYSPEKIAIFAVLTVIIAIAIITLARIIYLNAKGDKDE